MFPRSPVKNCGMGPSQRCRAICDQQTSDRKDSDIPRSGPSVSLRSESTDLGPLNYHMLPRACCVTDRQTPKGRTPHAVHHTTIVRRTRPLVHPPSLDRHCMRGLLSALCCRLLRSFCPALLLPRYKRSVAVRLCCCLSACYLCSALRPSDLYLGRSGGLRLDSGHSVGDPCSRCRASVPELTGDFTISGWS